MHVGRYNIKTSIFNMASHEYSISHCVGIVMLRVTYTNRWKVDAEKIISCPQKRKQYP